MAMALGRERRSTQGRNRPVSALPSGTKDWKKAGYPSINRSIRVTWMGMRGKGRSASTQNRESRME